MHALTLVLVWTALGSLAALGIARALRSWAILLPIGCVLAAGVSEAFGAGVLRSLALWAGVGVLVLAQLIGAIAGCLAVVWVRRLMREDESRREQESHAQEVAALEDILLACGTLADLPTSSASARRRFALEWDALRAGLNTVAVPLPRTRVLVDSHAGTDAASSEVVRTLRTLLTEELTPALESLRSAPTASTPAPSEWERRAQRLLTHRS